jgi:AraC family transcriptional regulator
MESKKLEPRFEEKHGFKFAGLMYTGSAEQGEIPQLWDKFVPVMDKIPNRINNNVCYGIINPFEPKQGREMDYIAAVEVDGFDNVPEGMESGEIPEAYYAVFTHKGPISKFMETIQYVYGDWMKNGGYKHAGTPDFELYDDKFKGDEEDSECYIYVPIEK